MIVVDVDLSPAALVPDLNRLFALAGEKRRSLQRSWDSSRGSPVYTVGGRYTTRGWTEWTQGFLFGMGILHFDAVGDEESLAFGKSGTLDHMAPHLTHTGVHDHGFNNVSTYGNLLRLIREGRMPASLWEERYYVLALKASAAVQASRWMDLPGELGYIYSFNGPHSLFVDTVRSLRILALGHLLGHVLLEEQDRRVSLLQRLLRHGVTSARTNVYHGEGRDRYDVAGRTAHEAVFNPRNGSFRCASSQQGYSAFTTWTRGLAWAVLGFAEELELLSDLPETDFLGLHAGGLEGKEAFVDLFESTARLVADYYITSTPSDGVPYWDTGAPGLTGVLPDESADPVNGPEPVDSSAAAIAAQGLIRLGEWCTREGRKRSGYLHAGLSIARTLFRPPYISEDPLHQGLLLHSIYHRPAGWDAVPEGKRIPSGESSMWGDYHALELGVLLHRLSRGDTLRFFGI